MAQVCVVCRNPLLLRDALRIAIEPTWQDVSPDHVERVTRLAERLPRRVRSARVTMDGATADAVVQIVSRFRLTQTWYWLREDLQDLLDDLLRQIRANGSRTSP